MRLVQAGLSRRRQLGSISPSSSQAMTGGESLLSSDHVLENPKPSSQRWNRSCEVPFAPPNLPDVPAACARPLPTSHEPERPAPGNTADFCNPHRRDRAMSRFDQRRVVKLPTARRIAPIESAHQNPRRNPHTQPSRITGRDRPHKATNRQSACPAGTKIFKRGVPNRKALYPSRGYFRPGYDTGREGDRRR